MCAMGRKGRALPHSRGQSPTKRQGHALICTAVVYDRRYD